MLAPVCISWPRMVSSSLIQGLMHLSPLLQHIYMDCLPSSSVLLMLAKLLCIYMTQECLPWAHNTMLCIFTYCLPFAPHVPPPVSGSYRQQHVPSLLQEPFTACAMSGVHFDMPDTAAVPLPHTNMVSFSLFFAVLSLIHMHIVPSPPCAAVSPYSICAA